MEADLGPRMRDEALMLKLKALNSEIHCIVHPVHAVTGNCEAQSREPEPQLCKASAVPLGCERTCADRREAIPVAFVSVGLEGEDLAQWPGIRPIGIAALKPTGVHMHGDLARADFHQDCLLPL